MTMQASGTDGFTFPDNTTQKTAFAPGMRNKIINGAMMIDQRNAGASVTFNSGVFATDRWASIATQSGKFTAQQNAGSVTPPAGFLNYLGLTVASAYSVGSGDTFGFRQGIEGFNTADFNWGTANASSVALSFWVYTSLTGTHSGALINATSTWAYPFTFSVSSANTWTKINITIAGPTSGTWVGATNGIGAEIRFNLGSGSTYLGTANTWGSTNAVGATGSVSVVGTSGATFYITGVQLEKGATATPFENRLYGTELALCQRYFESSWNIGTVPGSTSSNCYYAVYGGGGGTATTSFIGQAQAYFKVPKRTAPTITTYDGAATPNSGKCLRYTLGVISSNNETVTVETNPHSGFAAYSGNGASAMGIVVGWKAEAEL